MRAAWSTPRSVQLHTTPEGPPFGSGLVTHWAVSGTHPDAITPQGKQASSRPQAATTATITTATIHFMGPLLNAECSTA